MACPQPNFCLLHPRSNGEDREKLKRLLGVDPSNKGQNQLSDRLYRQVEQEAISVVVERDYIDLNFRAEFSKLHYIRHRDTPRRCLRLHLFSSDIGEDDPLHEQLPDLHDDYLGHIVIRPLPFGRPSRGTFSTKFAERIDEHRQSFLTCRAKYKVSIAGEPITFEGTCWMHQDKIVSACATAALWMVNWHYCHRHGPDFRSYYTSEITDMATKYELTLGRSIPSKGLTNDQMMAALNQMGYEPVFYSPKDPNEAKRLIYYYVESGIPVVLSLYLPDLGGGHVVTAVGHTLSKDVPNATSKFRSGQRTAHGHRSSDFVPSFIVQDDSGGPLRQIEIVPKSKLNDESMSPEDLAVVASCGASVKIVSESKDDSPEIGFLHNILIALPPWVTLDAVEAETVAVRALHQEKYWTGLTDLDYWRSLNGSPDTEEVVFRTFLCPSNDLKAYWLGNEGVPTDLAQAMGSHLMARWVWITEMTGISDFVAGRGAEAIAFVIQDAAGVPEGKDMDVIAIHVGHRLWLHGPMTDDLEVVTTSELGFARFDNRDFEI